MEENGGKAMEKRWKTWKSCGEKEENMMRNDGKQMEKPWETRRTPMEHIDGRLLCKKLNECGSHL